jgi:hypothetical protein
MVVLAKINHQVIFNKLRKFRMNNPKKSLTMVASAKINLLALTHKLRKFRKTNPKKFLTMEVLDKINHQVLINRHNKIQNQLRRSWIMVASAKINPLTLIKKFRKLIKSHLKMFLTMEVLDKRNQTFKLNQLLNH